MPAIRMTALEMARFLTEQRHLWRDDDSLLLSGAADFGITQVVNIRHGGPCGLPTSVFPPR